MNQVEEIVKTLQDELREKKMILESLQLEKEYIMTCYSHCDEKKMKLLQKQMEVSENKFANLYAEVMELSNKINKFKKS